MNIDTRTIVVAAIVAILAVLAYTLLVPGDVTTPEAPPAATIEPAPAPDPAPVTTEPETTEPETTPPSEPAPVTTP